MISLVLLWIAVAALGSLFFSTLTYSLRDFSRPRLAENLEKRGKSHLLGPTVEHSSDLIVVTAFLRLLSNILVLVGVLYLLHLLEARLWLQYLLAVVVTGIITLFVSVAIPHAASRHAPELMIAASASLIHTLWRMLRPVTRLMDGIDSLVARATTTPESNDVDKIEEEIEEEILSAVEEGEKEGVVDEHEREMIERVIEFHDTEAGQIMTPRPEIFAIDAGADLKTAKHAIAASGHSRIPVYEGSLDHVIGVLYARDLLKLVGEAVEKFDVRNVMRAPLFIHETKPLKDLLRDFALNKVHIAIVLDEHGGTSGLVTIEDIVEELVGELADEHEPEEPAMFKRIDDYSAEADARLAIEELNRIMGLNLPEEAGYETLGGFVSTTLGRIPASGESFEYNGVNYSILDAEPQKVNRVKIEMSAQPAAREERNS